MAVLGEGRPGPLRSPTPPATVRRRATASAMRGGRHIGRRATLLHVTVRICMADKPVENAASETRALLVQTTMPKRIHRCPFTLLFAGLLAIVPICVQASQTTISINATIVEVQCTAEQRARIRACAAGQESYATEPLKLMVSVRSASGGTQTLEAPYEIQLDPKRPVLIKTVLY